MPSQDPNYSYTQRSAANAQWDKIYEQFLSGLQLAPMDRAGLRARGLNDQLIEKAQYRTKPDNRDQQLQKAINTLSNSVDLAGVPGFLLKNEKRTVLPTPGIIVPSRALNSDINCLVIRRKEEDQHKGKYVTFSTPPKKHAEGGYARVSTHCPITHSLTKKTMGTTLRITEGVLKADVACALDPSIYTLGLPGLNAPEDLKWVLQSLEVSRILLAFDMESTVDVKIKSLKLLNNLKSDYDVTFEVWNPEFKGIDDALLKAPDSIRQLTADELKDLVNSTTGLDPMTSGYVYIIQTKTFLHEEDLTELDDQQFARTHGMESVSDVNELLSVSHNPYFTRYHGVEFYPGHPTVFPKGRHTMFNMWRPNPIDPEEGSISIFLEHLEHLVPDEFERQQLMNWMAFQVQNLGQKINYAALIQGEEGIGKSFIGHAMGAILGEHNISRPTNTELHETFTGWEKCCSLVIIEEVMAAGRLELMNKLKPKITEPMTRIREMHKPAYDQPNRYNMLLLTNHKNAIVITESDRRYLVIFSPAKPRSAAYNKRLFNWLHDDASKAALLHWALNYPLLEFESKAHAPKTKGRAELLEYSVDPLEEYVKSALDEKLWPLQMDIVSITDITRSLHLQPRLRRYSRQDWAAVFEKVGGKKFRAGVPVEIVPGQPKKRLWCIRRPDMWEQNTIENAQQHFAQWVNSQPGGNPLDDIAPLSA